MSAALRKIRAAVAKRAAGACEACGQWVGLNGEDGHLDHARGRGRAESVESCWLLCLSCDLFKTNNRPNAAHWLARFARHCDNHGYSEEARIARGRLAFVETRSGLGEAL